MLRLMAPTVGEYSLEASPHGAYFWFAHVIAMDGRYAGFAAVRRPGAKTGHRGMLLHRRSLIAVYLVLVTLAAFCRCYQSTMFAIGLMRHSDEHAMEACQIGSRSGYQGCQACDKVQWFEDDVGSTGPTKSRRFRRSIRYSQSIRCAHGLRPAHGASFLDKAS